jgi:hypothetical protein
MAVFDPVLAWDEDLSLLGRFIFFFGVLAIGVTALLIAKAILPPYS